MSDRKFSLFRPRLPRVSGVGDTTASSARWAKQAFGRSDTKCTTQGCEGRLEILDLVDDNQDAEEAKIVKSLACQTCGNSQPVEDLINHAATQIDALRSGERTFFLSGIAMFCVFAFLSFTSGNFLTFFGGAVFALLLMMRGFVFRYKAWQATNAKLFETKPPIAEFLRDEFSSKKSGA